MRVFTWLWFFAGLSPASFISGDAELLVGSIQPLPTRERLTSQWTKTRIDVLVVLEGPSDRVTGLTFRDIAETVQDGLHGLGHPSTIVYCANIAFDGCIVEGAKVIVLAAHNLASFLTMEGESVVLKWKLLPPDAVLYNFETVPRHLPRESSLPSASAVAVQPGGRGRDPNRSLVAPRTLQIYASYTLWDYSEGNIQPWRDLGVHAYLVPLGFSAKLESSIARDQEGESEAEDIDVLFIGMDTPTRRATIDRLREAGISVVHPNSEGIHLYGDEFDVMSARSKIVLNLNAFANDADECNCGSSSTRCSRDGDNDGSGASCNTGEWKMPRLARLLANRRFVVSEINGTPQERAKLSGGLVFVDSGEMAETCRYYLDRPQLRAAIGLRGRQLWERQVEIQVLEKPVEAMLRGWGDVQRETRQTT